MGFFDRLLKGVGVEEQKSNSQKEILLREPIKFGAQFLKEYEQWIEKEMHIGLLTHLKENYLLQQENSNANVNHFVHQSPNSNGFYFRAESPWDLKDYSFLIQLFIQKLKTQGYVLKNTLREAVEEEDTLKTIEEYYLKPSLKYRRETPYRQLFGNVAIEHQLRGTDTSLVKIVVNTYSDRNYETAFDFEDFMNEIFLF